MLCVSGATGPSRGRGWRLPPPVGVFTSGSCHILAELPEAPARAIGWGRPWGCEAGGAGVAVPAGLRRRLRRAPWALSVRAAGPRPQRCPQTPPSSLMPALGRLVRTGLPPAASRVKGACLLELGSEVERALGAKRGKEESATSCLFYIYWLFGRSCLRDQWKTAS